MVHRGWTGGGISGVVAFGLLLSGCAQTPLGPTVQVMPGPGKSFDAFQFDQAGCKAVRGTVGRRSGAERQQPGGRRRGAHHRARCGLGAAIGGGRGAGDRRGRRCPGRYRDRCGGQFQRAAQHPAAVRQRLRAVHVREGQHGARARSDDGPGAAAAAPRRARPDARRADATDPPGLSARHRPMASSPPLPNRPALPSIRPIRSMALCAAVCTQLPAWGYPDTRRPPRDWRVLARSPRTRRLGQ